MKRIDRWFLISLLLIQVNFFDLINIRTSFLNSLMSYSSKKFLLLIVILYFLLRMPYRRSIGVFSFTIMLTLVITILVSIGTILKFSQGIIATLFVSYYFAILILYYPMVKAYDTWEKWHNLIKIFAIFGFVLSISKIIQSFALSKFHVLVFFLNTNLDYNTATSLNHMFGGFTRIPSATDFVAISLVLIFVFKMHKDNLFSQKKDIFLISTDLFYLFFVGQTRSYQLLVVVVAIVYTFLAIKKSKTTNFMKLFFVLFLIFSLPIVIAFLKKQFLNSDRSVSISIRQEELRYYLSKIYYSHWFSLGFIREGLYSKLLHGPNYSAINTTMTGYALDDVGIVGFLGRFGLAGVPIMVSLFVQTINSFFKTNYRDETTILLVILFGSWISTSLFDPQRIFYMPILLAFMSFLATTNEGEI